MAVQRESRNHVFGRARPSEAGNYPIQITPKRDTHFRPLPKPTGKDPYQLDVKAILPTADYQKIVQKKRITFHLNGDMGGIKYAVPQELVAKGMEADFDSKADASDNPSFLYILGDCVYFNGEVKEYYSQFYQPYVFYPRPIFAVAGNHDGENVAGEDTLQGFVRNFCAPKPVKQPESGDSHRTAMVQPNVYWTLLTPWVNIVGLYSNVPEGGEIKPPQTAWLANQLKTLPATKPLFLALHHPIYSADDHHSGSTHMKKVLEDAVKQSGRQPEMVLAGHVHNYQRLTKALPGGKQLPHLVTGAGGYHNLHRVMKVNGEHMIPPVVFKDKDGDPVTLEKYTDDHHGFLHMQVSDKSIKGWYYAVPRPQEPYSKGNQLIDRFEFDWKKRRYIPNSL
jgi:hypothetical protein